MRDNLRSDQNITACHDIYGENKKSFCPFLFFQKSQLLKNRIKKNLITISPLYIISIYLIYSPLIQNKIRSIPIVLISANTIQGNAYVNAIYIYKYISKILIEKHTHTRKILLFIRFMENVMNYITAGLFFISLKNNNMTAV